MASKIIECLGVKQALTFKQLCQIFGISQATGWRRIKDDPQFPKPYYISEKCPRFDPDEVMSFRESRRRIGVPT
jgi:predicted DNA-binding transcriptional regulator AlpA